MESNKEKKSVKEMATDLFEKGKNWTVDRVHDIKEHKDEIVPVAITAIEGLAVLAGIGYSVHKANEASRTVYSEEIGETVVLNKKLSNRDKLEIDHLMAHDGMTKIEACDKIGRIKK